MQKCPLKQRKRRFSKSDVFTLITAISSVIRTLVDVLPHFHR